MPGSSFLSVLLYKYPAEEFLQVLVVGLQAAQQNALIVSQVEERPRHPPGRHCHAQLSPSIVAEDAPPFKLQLLAKGGRIPLNLQAITILPARAQLVHGPLPQQLALVEDQHRLTDALDIAEQVGGQDE